MNGTKAPRIVRGTVLLAALCLCMTAFGAVADGLMPMMPAPPETPVYWQLVSIDQEPTVTPSGGYDVSYQIKGLSLDLSDGLMAESLLENEASAWNPEITLTVSKGGVAMEHVYGWTALPVYLEPQTGYVIDVTGEQAAGGGSLNSLLGIYAQGEMLSRISAGGYTSHASAAAFTIDASATSLYNDGSLIYSFILRDVNDMFRLRVVYTYQMQGGIKPEPTPVPGFVAVELPDGALPEYYDPVPGIGGLWVVTTRPDAYRAYGSMSGSDPMFFPADAQGNVVMNEVPANPTADFDTYVKGFVAVVPASVPEIYDEVSPGLYAFTARDGETIYRRYGRVDGGEAAFYPSDAQGGVAAETAQPVDPAADYTDFIEGFGAARPETAFPHYRLADTDLYAFTGRDGLTRYRVFGRLDGAEPAYYPADGTGKIEEGAAPVTPQDDFDQYIKGFDATEPPELPAFYEAMDGGAYAVIDREGNPAYRAHGIKDGAAPAFYPSDAAGNVAEDADAVTPDEDFMAYIVGFEPVDMPDAPFYYDETNAPNVWTFEDLSGQRQYRAYGILNRGEEAFYPSDEHGNVEHDALPVQPASDLANMPPPKFIKAVPEAVPSHYEPVPGSESLYAFEDRDGKPVYRTYGAYGRAKPQFYPADAEGSPVKDADPIDPAQDFATYFEGFEPIAPAELPAYYTPVDGKTGVYRFEGRDGGEIRRVYGSKDRTEPAFYPADVEGNPIEPMEPVDPASDFAEHFEGFEPMTPAEAPTYYTPVGEMKGVYAFGSRDGDVLYRVYGSRDRGAPAFYPADAGGSPTSEVPMDPAGDIPLLPTPLTGTVVTPGAVQQPETTPIVREYESGELWPEATTLTGAVVTPGAAQQPETTPVTREYQSGELWPEATELTGAVVTPSAAQGPETTPVAREYESGELWPEATELTGAVVTPSAAQGPDTTPVVREFEKGEQWPEATELTSTVNPAASPTQGQAGIEVQLSSAPVATPSSSSIVQPETTGTGNPVVTHTITAEPTEEATVEPEASAASTADVSAPTDEPVVAQEAEKGNLGGWIALAAGVAVLVGGGGFFLLRKKK